MGAWHRGKRLHGPSITSPLIELTVSSFTSASFQAQEGDYIKDLDADNGRVWRGRGTRVSLTFRWMKPGAEVVGGDDNNGTGRSSRSAEDAS